jgi:hypothetical protein
MLNMIRIKGPEFISTGFLVRNHSSVVFLFCLCMLGNRESTFVTLSETEISEPFFIKLYFLVSFHHTEQGGVAHTLKPPPITKCQFSAKSPRPGAHGFITSAQLPLRTSIRVYPSGVRINAYLPQRKEIVSAFSVCR